MTNEPHYPTVIPYIIVEEAADFIRFMEKVFGATERYKMMRDETKIAHAELDLGDSVIMVADTTDQVPSSVAGIFLQVADTDTIHNTAILSGAISIMEPSDQPYGRASGVKDPWGNTWWITKM